MKIGDIAKISEDKTDAQKVADLIRSGQDINLAAQTYKYMHAGGLDYDAAFSKSSQERTGKNEPRDPRDDAQAKIDARAKERQKDARGKADKQKNKGEFKRDADKSKAKPTMDPAGLYVDKDGQVKAKTGFYGNQHTGSLGLGAVKGIRKYAKDPKQIIPDILSLGSDDVESSIGRGAAAGAAIGKIKGAGRRKPKFSLRDS